MKHWHNVKERLFMRPLNSRIHLKKVFLVIRLTAILLLFACLQISARGISQGITLTVKNASLKKVFKEIIRQSGIAIVYNEAMLQKAKPVSFSVTNATVEQVLKLSLEHQPLKYSVDEGIIAVQPAIRAALKNAPSGNNAEPPLISVTGKIVNENGEPAIGVTISVKGSKRMTSTDNNGGFLLKDIDGQSTLIISGANIETYEIRVDDKAILNITVTQKVSDLDAAIVVAYGKTTQRANTGAVAIVKGEQVQNLPNRSFDKSLQGMVPGLLVTSGSGQPGGGLANFVLRGIATLANPYGGSSVRNPLIVIDGMPVSQDPSQLFINGNAAVPVNNPLAQLNPSDIDDISVLKDAAAIALYGSKASNGVILITTKKGKSGKTTLGFRHQTDFSTALNGKNKFLNQQEYLELLNETYKNTPRVIDGVLTPWTDEEILADLHTKFPTRVDGSFYPSQDWVGELFNNGATTVANEFSMQGGNEKSNFYLNLEYTDQNGVLKNTGFDRKSVRFNFESRPRNWLKTGINSSLSYSIQDYGGALENNGNEAGIEVLSYSPLLPIRLEDGKYNMNLAYGSRVMNQANPAATGKYNTNRNTAFRGLTRFYAEVSVMRNLRITTNAGVDFMLSESKETASRLFRDPTLNSNNGRISEQLDRTANLISTNTFNYTKRIDKDHAIGLLGGMEAQIRHRKFLYTAVTNLQSDYYDQISSPGVTTIGRPQGAVNKETLLSYFGQLNYSFRNKYFISGSIRTDGSSRFGADKRFGTYWSTGAGWVLTEEKFMDRAKGLLNYLKLRGSIGAAGNAAAIDRFTPYDRIELSGYLNNTGVMPSGNIAGNPDVQWEQTFTWDAGVEARFLKERISFTADIYQRNTSDLISQTTIPLNTGFGFIIANIGDLTNRGVEIAIAADLIRNGNFGWNIGANWSTNRNNLTRLDVDNETTLSSTTANQVGRNLNSFYMPVWAGVNPADGSAQWIDSMGKISSDYEAAKKQFVGKPQPDGFGAVTSAVYYKGFKLSVMFYYEYGHHLYNYNGYVNDGNSPYANQVKQALNRWQKPGDIVVNPKPILNNPMTPDYVSTRNLFKADHIRLQNASISYNFPSQLSARLKVEQLRIFVQGNNLALWSKYSDRDISTVNAFGSASGSYPPQRSYSIGLNVNF